MAKFSFPRPSIMSEVKSYTMITLGLALYAFVWNFFMSPYEFLIGGVTGIGAIVQYSTNGLIPMQYVYFTLNILLLIVAMKILGWRFCVKTGYAIFAMTIMLDLTQKLLKDYNALSILGPDKQLEACLVGSIFIGVAIAICFLNNGSTGGVDIVAAIVNKYKDVSFGRAMFYIDGFIITSSYFIIPSDDVKLSLSRMFYGYITLVIVNVALDYMVNSSRQMVQFFIFSNKYEEIGYYITRRLNRGVTLLDSVGFYSKKEGKVITTLTRANQSNLLFSMVKQIDPNALISQSKVMGVYGNGFDKIKAKNIKLQEADFKKADEATDKTAQ